MIEAAILEGKLQAALEALSRDLYVVYTPANNRGVPCSVNKCPNVAYAKGMCNAHYLRAKLNKPLDAPLKQRGRRLFCLECGEPVDGKGGWALCKQHYRLRRRQTIRRISIEALGDKCSRCGGKFPDPVYDFHHVDPTSKSGSPSDMTGNASIASIASEVAKCELLCANCHRIEHNGCQKL